MRFRVIMVKHVMIMVFWEVTDGYKLFGRMSCHIPEEP
jgi:hypothetical protein